MYGFLFEKHAGFALHFSENGVDKGLFFNYGCLDIFCTKKLCSKLFCPEFKADKFFKPEIMDRK
jgi:hypothetical protein